MRFLPAFLTSRAPLLLLAALLPLTSCEDKKKVDPQPVPNPNPNPNPNPVPARTHNQLTIELEHNAPDGAAPFRFNTVYQFATGYTYKLDLLKYYVSNVKLLKADGTTWAEPVSYHLVSVDGAPADNPTIVLDSVPVGNYTQISFGIGVDATSNHTGDQPGDLSPNNGMTWNWLSGYKFWVMEGEVQPTGGTAQDLIFHIGFDPNYRTQTLTLPSAATVTDSIAPELHVKTTIDKVFGDPAVAASVVNLTDPAQRTVMGNSTAANVIATNISRMFTVAHVHNDKQ